MRQFKFQLKIKLDYCVHYFYLQDLVNNGALIGLCNRYDECPLDKANENLAKLLRGTKINNDYKYHY